MTHDFIVMWCNEGLEYVADITADEQRVIMEALKGNDSPRRAYANPFHLKLRAQFNTQRHYEIYYIGVEEGFTEQDIKDMFRRDPQGSADLIRRQGECFYSNRLDTNQSVIV
jgi:hypothetical protein